MASAVAKGPIKAVNNGRLIILFFFVVVFGFLSPVFAAPMDAAPSNSLEETIPEPPSLAEPDLTHLGSPGSLQSTSTDIPQAHPGDDPEKRASAGIFGGPWHIGDYKIIVVPPHPGSSGPKFPSKKTSHINVQVHKKERRSYKMFLNLHIVKYTSKTSNFCLYVYDTMTEQEVFDACYENPMDGLYEAAQSSIEFIKKTVADLDGIAFAAVCAGIVALLIPLISSLAAVPALI